MRSKVSPTGMSLQWHYNECDGISNRWHFDCLLNCLFRCSSMKILKPVSVAFVRGIHQWPVDSPYKGPVMWKMFPFDDIILCLRVSCQKDPTRHAYAWQIGPFWQDTLVLPLWLLGNGLIHMKLVTSACLSKWLSQGGIKPSWSLFWNWTFTTTHFVLLIWEFL